MLANLEAWTRGRLRMYLGRRLGTGTTTSLQPTTVIATIQ
ncbi:MULTISPECIES: hypothetical protein [Mesorhizobium]|nr:MULTISPECIES: hypothetical protein [Mesorhizobium]